MTTVLCRLEDLNATGAKGVNVEHAGEQQSLFVVRKDEGVFAYVNNCPHAGAPLEMQDDKFLDDDGEYIVCAMHGALFEIDSGLCIDGPCFNENLTEVPILVNGDDVILDV